MVYANVKIVLLGSLISSLITVSNENTQVIPSKLTTFNIWLQYSEGGKRREKQEISKYFARETSPLAGAQQQGTEHSNT
jgi:hypothetical protein